jgi:nicotinate-nucleotide pyrophosphorylase (carboxylating)
MEELEASRWLIGRALAEDLPAGDLTTDPLFGDERAVVQAAFVARVAGGVLCGLPVVRELFQVAAGGAEGIEWEAKAADGDRLEAGVPFLSITGSAGSILRLERTALNFLGRLSGIATHTRRWVEAISGTRARLFDTRKTTPGWRSLEKYAVRAGGGDNQRKSLSDAILLKDNHAGILQNLRRGKLQDWVRALRSSSPGVFLEVEVDSREEFLSALKVEVDAVLLDNFPVRDLRWAVQTRNELLGSSPGRKAPVLEASGGIRLENVREVAETGVERISAGALTHSSAVLDIGLDFVRAWDAGGGKASGKAAGKTGEKDSTEGSE